MIRKSNLNRVIFAGLHINPTINEFGMLTEQVKNNFNVFMISEAKLDDTFLMDEFIFEVLAKLIAVKMELRSCIDPFLTKSHSVFSIFVP